MFLKARAKLFEFYNWNFMFYEDSSIKYSQAENYSTFDSHDIAGKAHTTLKTILSLTFYHFQHASHEPSHTSAIILWRNFLHRTLHSFFENKTREKFLPFYVGYFLII
jgi:hypothetical protein